MADDRRRRFSQIERPRAAGGDAPDLSPGTDDRFGAVQGPGAAPAPDAAPAVARGHTDRFRPAAERPLEVEARADAAQPFVRCARCETDSSRFAARCTTCGEPLDTDEQRAFNERLWAERRAAAEAEAAARAEREAALEQARVDEAAARRGMAEALAREVGAAERRRLEGGGLGEPDFGPGGGGRWGGGGWGSGGGGWGSGGGWSGGSWGGGGWGDALGPGVPVGFRLLAALPSPWGVVAGVGAVALAVGLFLVKPVAGLALGTLLLALFTPGRWRWRGRRW